MFKIHLKRRNTKLLILLILIIIIIVSIILTENKNNKVETISLKNNVEVFDFKEKEDNKKRGWGIKRKEDHTQPDVGINNKKILEKYNGICMGNSESNKIYLTFDEGYEAGYTEEILKILKENDIVATFFITAHYLNTNEELVKQMIDDGHNVGNHTVNHKSMPELTDKEIEYEIIELHKAMIGKFNYEMKYMRPPMGEFSKRTLGLTKNLGYTTVMWSFAYEDWNENKQPSTEYAMKKILENVHSGEINLLHGNSKTNMKVLDNIIKEIKNMGYVFSSLDEFE